MKKLLLLLALRPRIAVMQIFHAFLCGIYGIQGIITEKKMFWIDALGRIARMADLASLWGYAIVSHFPTYDMRSFYRFPASSNSAIAIAAIIGAYPKPTSRSFIYELPESLANSSWFKSSTRLTVAFMATVFPTGIIGGNEIALAY